MPPLDVESAANTLRGVLIGRTAQTAAKTLSDVATLATAASTWTGGTGQKRVGCPATAVGEALLAWKEGSDLMKVNTAFPLLHGLDPAVRTISNTFTFRHSYFRRVPVWLHCCALSKPSVCRSFSGLRVHRRPRVPHSAVFWLIWP